MTGRLRAAGFLSVLATPLLVLGSAHELYLRNQGELDGFVSVLRPFWYGAIATAAVGLTLVAFQSRRWARVGLWAYYGAGLAFLAYSVARALPWGERLTAWTLDRAASLPVMLLLYAVATAWLARRDPAIAMKPLAAFAVVLLAQEGWRMGTRMEPAARAAPEPRPNLDAVDGSRPNVYHLVLDAFEPEHFDAAWPDDTALEGFVFFPGTRSLFPATAPSMASVFTSRRDVRGPRFLQDALASPDSLPQRLRAAGYRTVAYLPPVYPQPVAGFDFIVSHTVRLPPERAGALHRWLFTRLWTAVTLPADLVDRLAGAGRFGLSPEELRQMRTLRGSTLTQPITTLLSFERFLEHEASLPARGRYTLVHLLVPHSPFVLAADCTFSPSGTDVLAQSRCAALVMQRFLRRLEELGRLRDSIVLIHSDHGSSWTGGPLDASQPALLLIKPRQAAGALVRAPGPASLLDVTPTLLGSLGLPILPSYEGHRLLVDRPSDAGAGPAALMGARDVRGGS